MVNVRGLLVPFEVVTVIFRVPSAAAGVMSKFAVMDDVPVTVTLLTVIPGPASMVRPKVRLVPEILTKAELF